MNRSFRFVEDARVHRVNMVREGTFTAEAVHPPDNENQLNLLIFKFAEIRPGERKQPIPSFSIDSNAAEGLAEYLMSHIGPQASRRVFAQLYPELVKEAEHVIELHKDDQYVGGQALAELVMDVGSNDDDPGRPSPLRSHFTQVCRR